MTANESPQPGNPDPQVETRKGAQRPVLAVLALLAVGAIGLGLYGIGRPAGKNVVRSGACAKSLNAAQAIGPLVNGELAALTPATQPNDLASVAFDDTDGRKTTIGAFKGKIVLLNLWATWCVPCRAEMPALDRLQGAVGTTNFAVVAVSIDQKRLDRPRAFLKEIGANALPFYSDKTGEIVQSLRQTQKVYGLPTSVLIGADGCEIGTMAGPAKWDAPEAKTLIERVLKGDKAA